MITRTGELILLEKNAELIELRSVRVPEGLLSTLGFLPRQNRRENEPRVVDRGMFYLTSQRVTFVGSTRTLEFSLKRAVEVAAPEVDVLQIGIANRKSKLWFHMKDYAYVAKHVRKATAQFS